MAKKSIGIQIVTFRIFRNIFLFDYNYIYNLQASKRLVVVVVEEFFKNSKSIKKEICEF